MKTDRLLGIVLQLLRRGKISAKELSEYYDVSIRTIQRDIDAISSGGIPIYADRGKDGGYSILENYKIKNSFLTDREVAVILKVLHGVKSGYDSMTVNNLIEKFEVVKDQNPQFIDDKLEMDFSYWGDSSELKRRLHILEKGIDNTLILETEYGSSKGEVAKREIEPHKLLCKSGVWYIIGYCLLRKAFRVFKISRFVDIKLSRRRFKRREVPKSSLTKSWKSEKVETIVLKVYKGMISKFMDYYYERDGKIDKDGSMVVTLKMPLNDWTYGYILSYGSGVEVLEPQWLRDEIKDILKRNLARYS